MRINYHTISSKISDRQTFREYIHGASRYAQLINTNIFKFKNLITTSLRITLKPLVHQVAFTSEKMLERIRILLHQKSNNEITFDDDSKFHVREVIKPKDKNIIKVANGKVHSVLDEIIKPKESNVIFKNNNSGITLREEIHTDSNDIIVENSNAPTKLHILNEPNGGNTITFENGKVNISASYLTRLKMMSGSLNDYYNQTIADTGKRKIN